VTVNSPPRPAPRTPLGKRLLLAATTVVGMLVVAEVILRIAVPEPITIRFAQDTQELQQLQLDKFGGVLINDPIRFWKLAPHSRLPESGSGTDGPFFGVISNGDGFRENHDIAPEKSAEETRILFLGDSCTFGYGVGWDQTFVAVCEDRLNNRSEGRRFECINAGVPGYSLYQGFQVLDDEGPRVKPDVVVACFGFNDRSEWDGLSDLQHAALAPPGWMSGCRLTGRLWRMTHPPSAQRTAARKPRVSPDEFRGLLTRIRTRTRQLGARLALISWCERFQVTDDRDERTPWQRELDRFARRHRVPMLDLVPLLQRWADEPDQEPQFLDIVHATPATHSRIAGQVIEILEPVLGDGGSPE